MEVSRVGNFIYKFPKRTGCKFNQLMVRYSLTIKDNTRMLRTCLCYSKKAKTNSVHWGTTTPHNPRIGLSRHAYSYWL